MPNISKSCSALLYTMRRKRATVPGVGGRLGEERDFRRRFGCSGWLWDELGGEVEGRGGRVAARGRFLMMDMNESKLPWLRSYRSTLTRLTRSDCPVVPSLPRCPVPQFSADGEMGLKHREYLCSERIFGCHQCRTHLSTIECVISKARALHRHSLHPQLTPLA